MRNLSHFLATIEVFFCVEKSRVMMERLKSTDG